MLDTAHFRECEKCGAVVADIKAHRHWHEAVKEVVECFTVSIDSLEEAVKLLLNRL